MLFSEIYGSYFQVVAAVLTEAATGCLTEQRITELVQEKAFAESGLTIPAALQTGSWPLLDQERHSVLRHTPTMPLTLLQKRWLKALLEDPRIRLFMPSTVGLEDVEPLYRPDTFVFFDRYTDGDPYQDDRYAENFRTILRAIHEKRILRVRFHGHTGMRHSVLCKPIRLEYSAKDDKFRLQAAGQGCSHTINLARIHSCTMLDSFDPDEAVYEDKDLCQLTLELCDERNALERVLLHFSHFEKETMRLEGERYQVKLRYDKSDETELLIRVLLFGPMLEVKAPESFVALVRARIQRQCARKRDNNLGVERS